jgi:hypothetical protein
MLKLKIKRNNDGSYSEINLNENTESILKKMIKDIKIEKK